tara:strand:+ start:390 stop:1823 length:1434 start_codon:yes stop_codon:yes gene_type:complete
MMIDNIIVVGGGNAGYVSALLFKRSFPNKEVRIIKSKDIGTIGVGESSSEHFADFCRYCNIPILELILEAKSTFKNGVYFENWASENYLHSVNVFNCAAAVGDHLPYMQNIVANNRPNYEMTHWAALKNQIPIKSLNDLNTSPTNQFHFDTQALNKFLEKICRSRNILIIEDDIESVDIDSESGNITSVNGSKKYNADFFIDCSGFSRLLLNKALDINWKSYSEYLPLNSAISFATDDMDEYNMYTKATARDYGWSWQIPTQGRTGNGYVFCDKYIDYDKAHKEMEIAYDQKLEVAKVFKFDPGRLERAWYKNCYAVGLSQSFVEPLEATAIGSAIQQMFIFVHYFPSYSVDECNQIVNDLFENIFDFVQAHYLTKKEDTPFWRDIKNNLNITPSLQKSLDLWKRRFPLTDDLIYRWGMFNAVNYIQILYGLKWFDTKMVAEEYEHISHIPITKWEDTKQELYIGHKQIIQNLNKGN